MSTVIKTNNLTKRYGQVAAVNQVNFNLREGEIYGLIGKNGAGKSTLLKMLMGLARPTSGNVVINQQESESGLNQERNKIGFMLEPTFFPYLNAVNNLKYFANLKRVKSKEEIDRVLKLVNLDGVKKPVKAYSL